MRIEPNTVIANALTANLAALSQRLSDAARLAEEAHAAMAEGQYNQAIGAIMCFEHLLPEAQALFGAVLALHRGSVAE